jgi:hypothetical protein
VAAAGLANLKAPLPLDVEAPWPVARADAILCVNMIHISPWSATLALFAGAAKVLGMTGAGVATVKIVPLNKSAAAPAAAPAPVAAVEAVAENVGQVFSLR